MPKDTLLNLEEEKRNKIIEAAIKEFSQKGYEKGNVGSIAKNAGVSKGSMYQYFNNKGDVYLYCIEKAYEIALKYVDKVTKDCYKMSIFDYIYLSFKNTWSFLIDERDVYVLLQTAVMDTNNVMREKVIEIINNDSKKIFEDVVKNININKEKGLIKTDISTDLILMYVTAIISKFKENMLIMANKKGKEFYETSFDEYEPVIKDMISLIKNGIG